MCVIDNINMAHPESVNLLVKSLKTCSTHIYNTGILDGMILGFFITIILLYVVKCVYLEKNKQTDLIHRLDILEARYSNEIVAPKPHKA